MRRLQGTPRAHLLTAEILQRHLKQINGKQLAFKYQQCQLPEEETAHKGGHKYLFGGTHEPGAFVFDAVDISEGALLEKSTAFILSSLSVLIIHWL